MTALQTFQKTLTEIVSSDKLSSSRVDRIRSEAAENFDNADDMASIIVQVHDSAKAKTKISSLYLFDAMARCAQEVIRRKASGFKYKNSRPPKGSSSAAGTKEAMIDAANAFLGACAKIVEEIVLSTAQSVRQDQREKVAKVVDIWIKANTFETGMLERVRSKALRGEGASHRTRDDEKGNSMGSPYGMLMNEDEERRNQEVTSKTAKSPPAPAGIPANLLALLGGTGGKASPTEAAKPANNAVDQGQPSSTSATTAGTSLDPNQLAMLRRVAAQQEQEQQQQQQRKSSWQRPGSEDRRVRQGSREASLPPRTNPAKQYQQNNQSFKGETINENESTTNSNANFWVDANVGDLSNFDLSSFDPTKSENWLKVAQQWYNTYEYCPSNQELLVGIMSVMQSQMYMQSQMMGVSGGNDGGFEANDEMQAEMQHTSAGWN